LHTPASKFLHGVMVAFLQEQGMHLYVSKYFYTYNTYIFKYKHIYLTVNLLMALKFTSH
ncbi:hypothetical protein ACJX0J_036239, partial [Zea mays]